MRTHLDRLRHSLLYECLLLVVTIPLLSILFNQPASHIGGISVMLSLTAMVWNYLYNIFFDHGMKRFGLPLYPRSFKLRALHAVLFELGLLSVTVPAIMYGMKFTFLQALSLDLSFLVIVPIYTIIYNGIYDWVFPVKEVVPVKVS